MEPQRRVSGEDVDSKKFGYFYHTLSVCASMIELALDRTPQINRVGFTFLSLARSPSIPPCGTQGRSSPQRPLS